MTSCASATFAGRDCNPCGRWGPGAGGQSKADGGARRRAAAGRRRVRAPAGGRRVHLHARRRRRQVRMPRLFTHGRWGLLVTDGLVRQSTLRYCCPPQKSCRSRYPSLTDTHTSVAAAKAVMSLRIGMVPRLCPCHNVTNSACQMSPAYRHRRGAVLIWPILCIRIVPLTQFGTAHMLLQAAGGIGCDGPCQAGGCRSRRRHGGMARRPCPPKQPCPAVHLTSRWSH